MAILRSELGALSLGVRDETDEDGDEIWFDEQVEPHHVYVSTSNDGAYLVRDDALEVVKWLIQTFQFAQSSLYPATPAPTDNAQTQEPSSWRNDCTPECRAAWEVYSKARNLDAAHYVAASAYVAAAEGCEAARRAKNSSAETLKENP